MCLDFFKALAPRRHRNHSNLTNPEPAQWTNVPTVSVSPRYMHAVSILKRGMADAHDAARCGGEVRQIAHEWPSHGSQNGQVIGFEGSEPMEALR